MEVVNEVVAMIRLDNLEEINTVRNALHKVIQMESRLGFNQKLLSQEEKEALQDIASSLVGYNQVNEPPQQPMSQPQYQVVQMAGPPPTPSQDTEPEMEEKKKKTKKKVGS